MSECPTTCDRPAEIVGVSPWACQVREAVGRLASRLTNVLVFGPTGTGKEIIARAIHEQGPRAARPFVAVDCAAAGGEIFASQLFGHVKGALAGADASAPGAFRAAQGGTVFLDEVGELEPAGQAKLLRVLQQRTVTPLGSHEEFPVNVRVVATTSHDLAADVAAGRFRHDLYYRLAAVTIEATALRSRREDVPPLAEHFLQQIAESEHEPLRSLAPAAVAELIAHHWPGNARELRNVIERAAAFAEGTVLDSGLLAAAGCGAGPLRAEPAEGHAAVLPFRSPGREEPQLLRPEYPMPTVEEAERTQILMAMQIANQNQSHAATMLGISRQQLRRRLDKHFPDSLPGKRGRPRSEHTKRRRAA